MELLKVWFATFVSFMALDMLWLGVIMKKFYHEQMGDLLRKSAGNLSPNWLAAILLYVIMVAGLVVFVLPRLNASMPWWEMFGWGFFYGIVLYSVYDLTNFAILKNWPLSLTIVDLIWGGLIFGISTLIMFKISNF
jgi:uncharacterized membrane protein